MDEFGGVKIDTVAGVDRCERPLRCLPGDLIFVVATNETSSKPPTLSEGFTLYARVEENGYGFTAAYRIANSLQDQSGVWNGATSVEVGVFRSISDFERYGASVN